MNRRTFLTGLLATTAAVPLAKAAPIFAGVDVGGADRTAVALYRMGWNPGVTHALIYWSEAAPVEFTGYEFAFPRNGKTEFANESLLWLLENSE